MLTRAALLKKVQRDRSLYVQLHMEALNTGAPEDERLAFMLASVVSKLTNVETYVKTGHMPKEELDSYGRVIAARMALAEKKK